MDKTTPSDLSSTQISARPAFAERFEIIDTLGKGGAGVVYKVRDRLREGEVVALKVLSSTQAIDEHTLARFRAEIELCKSIHSPHIVEAYELIKFGDTYAYTMEYVQGSDLSRLCAGRALSESEAIKITQQVLEGLSALHAKDVIHRDLKLENILIDQEGRVKISDLGLVKQLGREALTRSGILLGTAQYLPPEYIREGRFEKASDIYALGLMLLEMLSGRRWLDHLPGNKALDHLLKINFKIDADFWSSISSNLRFVIERATSFSANNRYRSCEEMQKALELMGPTQASGAQEITQTQVRPALDNFGKLDMRRSSAIQVLRRKRKTLVLIAFALSAGVAMLMSLVMQ